MPLDLTFEYDSAEQLLRIAFRKDCGELRTHADLERFGELLEAQCRGLPGKVHFFLDLDGLTVAAELVEGFCARKQAICEQFALTVWHFGGSLAERVMVRNAAVGRRRRANLFKTRGEALAAFHRARSSGGVSPTGAQAKHG